MRAPSLRGMLVGMAVLVVLVLLINATAHTHVAPGAAQQPEALHDHHQPWNGPPQEASAASGPADSQVAVWLKQMAGRAAPAAPPVKELRFVWLRPFVHGEAVVTNALHRIALRRKLELGLPKDLENLMFPRAEQLAAQMLPPLRADKIAVLCTGRAQYDRQRMAAVVRDAAYFTMFEDPATQLLHVWRDWDFATRYPELGATFGEFVDRLPGGLPLLAEEDRRRVWNPQVHLLGVPEFPSSEQLSLTLHHVQEHFQLLLVSEFLDESLVLLAHALRVSIGEVAHIARLWRKSAERISDDAHRDDQIRLLNHHDWDFYRVFNATLWERIAQTPGFQDDLAELQRLSAGWVQTCQSATSTPDDERLGLLALNELTESQRQCQLMLLPASGFGQLFGRTDATCPPHDKAETMQNFVWIKTHKTGSSTITNLLHRYITKHNRTAVLPKDNIYLGWPADDLETAYDPLPGHSTYNALCSAHARYARKKMDALVPNAVYFTILRDPYTQFTSAWSYWDLGSLVHLPGMQLPLTLQRYINAWDHFYKGVTTAAKFLFWNSQAYDLGLAQNTPEEKMPAILNRLEQEFDLVMITEYMDESLVLLARLMCWTLEDILLFPLKVAFTPKEELGPGARKQIYKMNNIDFILYKHFNATFWRRFNAEQGIHEEVAAYRKLRASRSEQCEPWASRGEDFHRDHVLRADAGEAMSQEQYECHLALMDSMAYSKYLKQRAGLPVRECYGQYGWHNRVVYIHLNTAGDDVLANVLGRAAMKFGGRVILPKRKDNSYGSMAKTDYIVGQFAGERGQPNEAEGICCGSLQFNRPLIDSLVPVQGSSVFRFVMMLENPVDNFLRLWDVLRVQEYVQQTHGQTLTIEQFITAPSKYASLLAPGVEVQLRANYANVLGLSTNEITLHLRNVLEFSQWRLVGLTERFLESLVVLRRYSCWFLEDILFLAVLAVPNPQRARDTIPPNVRTAIANYRFVDMHIYQWADAVLKERTNNNVAFDLEVAKLKQFQAEFASKCDSVLPASAADVDAMIQKRGALTKEHVCGLAKLDAFAMRDMLQRLGTPPTQPSIPWSQQFSINYTAVFGFKPTV
eukprot:m.238255 g.238255  ORF g.238255 m.238255 type:complete len:1089 (-) comp10916_c0_seq8:295-3561(-)